MVFHLVMTGTSSFNMKYFLLLITLISFSASAQQACPDYKATICHAGNDNDNPGRIKYNDLCVSFSSLYGHFAEHDLDYYGPCRLKDVKAPYACNAGMRQKDSSATICIQRDIDGDKYVESCGESKNCVCSGPDNQYLYNYFIADVVEFNPFLDNTSAVSTLHINSGKNTYEVATTSPSTTKIIDDGGLSFNIGSDRMNAEYFVDMCWMNTTGEQEYSLDFNISSNVISNSDNGQHYPTVSDLHSKYLLYCDYEFDGLADYSSLEEVSASSRIPYRIGGDSTYEYTVSNAEFCILRQGFKEKKPEVLRPWDLKKITVQNDLIIDVPDFVSGPINICHVQEITNDDNNGTHSGYSDEIDAVTVGLPFITTVLKPNGQIKSQHECTQLRFNDSDHLREFVKFGKDNKTIRDIHQHDYVGTCRSACGPIHGNGAN